MAIAQRTVSINPAFLQEIKDDNHELRQLLHHTTAMLTRSGPAELEYPKLVEMLSKLRDQMALHFSLEEAYGYFEDAIAVAPHLSRRAEELRSCHPVLFGELCRLVDASEQLLYQEQPSAPLTRLAQDYRRFCSRFHEHESQENELILQAFTEDIGTGD